MKENFGFLIVVPISAPTRYIIVGRLSLTFAEVFPIVSPFPERQVLIS
jgi:hypothetical protein